MAVSVKMSSKNQIVVPKEARLALGLQPGDRLAVEVDGVEIRMEKLAPDLEDHLRGSLKELGPRDELWAELVDD
ncbi:MAG: AbrB/MazE/SpoVT family DNA-binding domain-containing protein [Gemmatimonadetes bacterium]|nr:AbrB/MazE/SpoVT family DNA-binding domain-containing protein [Gemmatimonadota bacterium]